MRCGQWSQSAIPGLGIDFEKTQPWRDAISLNSFIGQYGAAGRPTKKTGIPVLELAITSCVNSDKALNHLSEFLYNCEDNSTFQVSIRREEQRTLQVTAPPGTCGPGWAHTKGVFSLLLCWAEKDCSIWMVQRHGGGGGGAFQVSHRGAASPESPAPLLRGMRNDYLPSLPFSAQMRCVNPSERSWAPGPTAVWWDHQ